MRIIYIFSFVLCLLNKAYSQSVKNNNSFILTGEIIGTDTGTIRLNYWDTGNNQAAVFTKLVKGKFEFSGKINQISDAFLWTDLNSHTSSDSSVIRFLLEPGFINVLYNQGHAIIKGSKSQLAKEKWEKEKTGVLALAHLEFNKRVDSLNRLYAVYPDTILRKAILKSYPLINSNNETLKNLDLQYIKDHEASFLSAHLLSQYRRRLPIDTLQVYYSLLSEDVKKSSEGYKVLSYIYPLTGDNKFRNDNPLSGDDFNKSLNDIKSVHDFKLNDTAGNEISFETFRGKYLLIDFWASWCAPCIKNFPFFEKLMTEYKSDPIQFISVSLDSESSIWKESVKKYNLPGLQLSDSKAFSGLLPVYCKVVTSLPRYVLTDKEGKIIDFDTPFPDDPDLKKLLNRLLQKKN